MRRQKLDPRRVQTKQRISNLPGRHETSKALYYTLASSTVLEKTTHNGNTRELDNVFLAAAKYGDMDILLRTLDRHSININVRDETNGDTALILASRSSNSKVVEALVERGADVTALNEDGKGALDIGSNLLRLAVLSRYPKNTAQSGVSVIKAAWQGDIVSLRNLLVTSPGTKITNTQSEEGLTPLLVVTRDVNIFLRLQRSIKLTYEPTKVIQELLKHKANVNAMDMEGHTALHFATRISAQKLCRDIVDLLLSYRPLLNILDRTNLAPLHTATNNDNLAVVSALVAAGANPNLHGIGGATPLHIGAQQDNEDIIRKLVLAGGDVNALDSAGMTPLCVARSNKIRELMRSLFSDLAADKGIEIKLKHDELLSKRKIQKLLEPAPIVMDTQDRDIEIAKPDYKPLQRRFINDFRSSHEYDYNSSQRVPRLVEGKRVTLDYSTRRRSSVEQKHVVSLLPRIDRENPVLLLKRHSPIEVPVLQRHNGRLKNINPHGVFITQRQNSKRKQDKSRSRPPIPKHTCGFVKNNRQGSAKTRKSDKTSNVSSSIHGNGAAGAHGNGAAGILGNVQGENEQWLPGAPIIMGSDRDSSRPTSAVTSSSKSHKGPKIHLKHVLKNILANMEASGDHHEDLLDRYVKQQRPVRVKEMGFVDFLLQDPEKMSEASSSVRSHNFSDSSSLSAQSFNSPSLDSSATPPVFETIAASRITVGETTAQMQLVNLPSIRQLPAPAPAQNTPLKASSKPGVERQADRQTALPRPHNLTLRRNSQDPGECKKVPVVNIDSPFSSPLEHPPRISSRSSKDSGYGSMATLLTKSQQQADPEDTVPDEYQPPKHITSVIVMQEKASREEVPGDDVTAGDDVTDSDVADEDESDDSNDEEPPITTTEIKPEEEDKRSDANQAPEEPPQEDEADLISNNGPIVGICTNIGILHGQRIKTVQKLSNVRVNKFKEQAFKKKVYNRRLPQIKEESRSRREHSGVSRHKKKEKRVSKSARSGTSESSGEKQPAVSRPGTVPSKPILGTNKPSGKLRERPKTSGNKPDAEKLDEDVFKDEDVINEDDIINEIESKHDATLLKKLTTVKDLDALVSTLPLHIGNEAPSIRPDRAVTVRCDPATRHPSSASKLDRVDSMEINRELETDDGPPLKEQDGPPPGRRASVDNRSLFSDGRSIITHFTGTTRIESIMGETTQWRKGRLLGAGGGGKVWYGMTQEKIEVAVKQIELYGEHEEAKDEYMELQEEVKLLKCLKHENIIRYYGTCLQDNNVNIFMEFVDGGSLAGRIKKQGTLPERTIQSFTYQLLDALRYIHAKNIVHRDIKGQNILITHDDQVKMIDFGCSKRLRRSLQNADALKTFRGTPYWMAPEVITGCGHGTKSDIWSLSCTVYEMLTGNPPWHSYPTMAAIYKIGTGNPVPGYPDNGSDYCIDFMKDCFIVDTKQRPSADDLLKHEFIELFSNRIKSDNLL